MRAAAFGNLCAAEPRVTGRRSLIFGLQQGSSSAFPPSLPRECYPAVLSPALPRASFLSSCFLSFLSPLLPVILLCYLLPSCLLSSISPLLPMILLSCVPPASLVPTFLLSCCSGASFLTFLPACSIWLPLLACWSLFLGCLNFSLLRKFAPCFKESCLLRKS